MTKRNFSEITSDISELSKLCTSHTIDPSLYDKYDVKRGLRDLNGKGVLTGLTEIGDIHAYDMIDGKQIPCAGRLFYRGYDLDDIVTGFLNDNRFGFEEVIYLLLFGSLPTMEQLDSFNGILVDYRSLPPSFVRDIILKAPSRDMMTSLSRSVLTLYSYDENADDISVPNVLRQSLQLISLFPMLSVYGYKAYRYYQEGESLVIHWPDKKLSTAETILHMLRDDSTFTPLEARILDIALVLQAEHGGGNNSTFTTHVVSSSGTDTYSAISASLGSLKGPKHGGASLKVFQMFEDIKASVSDWNDDEEISRYLTRILHREAFDNAGLIYGMGHAVYSVSDPRAVILKRFAERLSEEKCRHNEFELYANVERLAPVIIAKERKMYKGVSANVDFYSGLVYHLLNLPLELYIPIFAISRISGWSAHRIEELINAGKIIRPAYKYVSDRKDYIPVSKR